VTELHLHRWVLDARAVLALAKAQRLLGHRGEVDHGYITHAALQAVFGDAAPKPFVAEDDLAPAGPGRADLALLAYSPHSHDALRERARREHLSLVQWERSSSKPVPPIEAGTELGFTAKASPTVRTRRAAPGHEGSGRGHAREVDAFLAACVRAGDGVPVDRAAVYQEWLARELGGPTGGAASLGDFSLLGFQRMRLLRKQAPDGSQGRLRHLVERPSALVTGTLRVGDAAAFRRLIARGLGRHRAFGFGMLLVRRP
jgi:CRISPR system Cascade subunit CasE